MIYGLLAIVSFAALFAVAVGSIVGYRIAAVIDAAARDATPKAFAGLTHDEQVLAIIGRMAGLPALTRHAILIDAWNRSVKPEVDAAPPAVDGSRFSAMAHPTTLN